MEFFNKKEEVIDLQLTEYGKYLLSLGKFKPIFYAGDPEGKRPDSVSDETFFGIMKQRNPELFAAMIEKANEEERMVELAKTDIIQGNIDMAMREQQIENESFIGVPVEQEEPMMGEGMDVVQEEVENEVAQMVNPLVWGAFLASEAYASKKRDEFAKDEALRNQPKNIYYDKQTNRRINQDDFNVLKRGVYATYGVLVPPEDTTSKEFKNYLLSTFYSSSRICSKV